MWGKLALTLVGPHLASKGALYAVRRSTPRAIANASLLLASDKASYDTGGGLVVNGGASIQTSLATTMAATI